jgi:hypothetical protein
MLRRTRKSIAQMLTTGTFFTCKNLFILSHQRSRSTLLSHILGSSQYIEGYYEAHFSYHSNKDIFWRRFLYAGEHELNKNSLYFLDKVLHDENVIAEKFLKSPQNKFVFLSREPVGTISSLIQMYKNKGRGASEAERLEKASAYYLERLDSIQCLWGKVPEESKVFIESECLISDSELELQKLQHFLDLPEPLNESYQSFKYTGVPVKGDPSENIKSQKIIKEKVRSKAVIDATALKEYGVTNQYEKFLDSLK